MNESERMDLSMQKRMNNEKNNEKNKGHLA